MDKKSRKPRPSQDQPEYDLWERGIREGGKWSGAVRTFLDRRSTVDLAMVLLGAMALATIKYKSDGFETTELVFYLAVAGMIFVLGFLGWWVQAQRSGNVKRTEMDRGEATEPQAV